MIETLTRRKFIVAAGALGAASMWTGNLPAKPRKPLWVPPEEAPHELTFMQWPVSQSVYDDAYFLGEVQQTIANIANTISDYEPVMMLAAQKHHKAARKLLSENVELWDIPTDDLWARDSGPLFAINDKDELVISHIQFNGWGRKQVHTNDGRIVSRIAERLGVKVIASGLKGEAGGVEHDGHGLLMAHESSWVIANRNKGLSKQEIETRLLKAYGADKMIWAPGLAGWDITDYHIDSLARFTGAGKVLLNLPELPDQEDPFHMAALKTFEVLDSNNLDIEVIWEPDDRRVPGVDFVASYANYYACNGAIIMAEFGDKEADTDAVDAMKEHFPSREIIALNVDALAEIGGGIHCATQQMPKI